MANKNLTDLTARTATADSDLIHVNSGGVDYKESKADFLKGSFYYEFGNTSLITSQVDSLPTQGTWFGRISSYGKQSETGAPENSNGDLFVQKFNGNYAVVDFHLIGNPDLTYRICKANGTWNGSWTKLPQRSEITSLNSSLTQSLLASVTKHVSISSVIRSPYSVVGNIVVGAFVFTNGANPIPTGSTILKLNDLPGNFRATYDLVMTAGGDVIMGYTDSGSKNIKNNGTVPANATVFGMFVGSIS